MCRLPKDSMKTLMPKSHEHSTFNERGMSLIELLVGVAIASVVLTACYGSYVVVTGYYRTQSDISHVRQTLRQTLEILGRDIQRAGFVYLETAGSQITEPLHTTTMSFFLIFINFSKAIACQLVLWCLSVGLFFSIKSFNS